MPTDLLAQNASTVFAHLSLADLRTVTQTLFAELIARGCLPNGVMRETLDRLDRAERWERRLSWERGGSGGTYDLTSRG